MYSVRCKKAERLGKRPRKRDASIVISIRPDGSERPMHRNILLLILIASAGVAQADLIVAPSANTSANGNADTIVPLGEQDDTWTFQWQLAGSQLSAMVGDTVTGIGFRLATGESSVPAGTSIGSWNLELSSAANALGSLSSTVTS